jgi:hypothetical protein
MTGICLSVWTLFAYVCMTLYHHADSFDCYCLSVCVAQFIIALGQIVVAMAVSTWYFTRDKSTINSSTVYSSIKMASWYHAGTAAFGTYTISMCVYIYIHM